MDLRYVRNFKHDDKVHKIFLFSDIGPNDRGTGIDGQRFADELMFLLDFHNAEFVKVLINSAGGSVIHGQSVFNAIHESRDRVHTHIAGIAASSAGWISQAGGTRTMNDFARLVLHPVSGDRSTPEKKLIVDEFESLIIEVMANNTNKSEDQIRKMMDKTTVLRSQAAKSGGFVDSVIPTKRKPKLKTPTNDLIEIINSVNELYEEDIIDDKHKKTNKPKMEFIKNLLGLDSTVNEETVNNKVKSTLSALETSNNTITEKDKEIKELKEKNTEFETKAKEATDKLAVDYVENKIKEGVYKEDNKDALITQAKNGFDVFKTITESITTTHADISNGLKDDKGNVKGISADRKDWSFDKWQKEDESGLVALKNEAPDTFFSLYEKEYGVKHTDDSKKVA